MWQFVLIGALGALLLGLYCIVAIRERRYWQAAFVVLSVAAMSLYLKLNEAQDTGQRITAVTVACETRERIGRSTGTLRECSVRYEDNEVGKIETARNVKAGDTIVVGVFYHRVSGERSRRYLSLAPRARSNGIGSN
jgi:hypothetical protein